MTTTSAVPTRAPALDLNRALALTGGNAELLTELAEIFLRDAPAQIAALQAAEVNHDANALRRTAHTIKGAARLFGARLAEHSAELVEHCANSDDLQQAAFHCRGLISAVSTLCAELDNFIAGECR